MKRKTFLFTCTIFFAYNPAYTWQKLCTFVPGLNVSYRNFFRTKTKIEILSFRNKGKRSLSEKTSFCLFH